MPALTELCRITATLLPRMVGPVPQGTRIDFGFEGTATSPHWEGERPVRGVDYAVVRGDGNMDLEIRATIGEKRETLAYRGTGVSIVHSQTHAQPQELITFQTASPDLAWLNTRIGVALGDGRDGQLSITVYLVEAD